MRTANRNRNTGTNSISNKNASAFSGRKLLALAVATAAASSGVLPSTANALTYNWTPTAAGTFNWDEAVSNWTAGFPNAAGDVANLTANLAGAETINLNVGITLGALNIGDPTATFFGYTIAPGTAGSLTFNNGGTSSLTTSNVATGVTNLISANVTLADNLSALIQNTNALSITGNITESGVRSLTKAGSATGGGLLTLSGNNNYSGGTFINSGGVRAGSNTALGTGAVTVQNITGTLSQLQLANGVNVSNALTLASGGVTAQGLLYMPVDGAATYSGTINITGNATAGAHFATGYSSKMTIAGNNTITSSVPVTARAGWVIYSGSQNYTSGTTLNGGMIQFAQTTSMPATGAFTVANGTAMVNVGGAGEWTIGGSGAGTVPGMIAGVGGQGSSVVWTAGSSALGIDTTNATGTQTLSAWFGTNQGLIKAGPGTLELTGNGNYTGGGAAGFSPVVRQGTLLITSGTHTSGSEMVIGGNFGTANGGAGLDASLVMNGGSLNVTNWFSVGRGNGVGGVSSDVTLNNNAVLSSTNFSAGFNAATGNLPKGTITLNGTSSYTVTATANNTFQLGETAGSNMTLNMNDNSVLTVATGGSTGERNIGVSGIGTVNLTGNAVMSVAQDPVLGRNAGGVGTLNIGGNAVFNAATTTTKWFQIGFAGQGIVNVNGGTLKVNTSTELNFSRGTSTAANSVNQNSGNVTFYSDNGVTVGGTGGINMARGGTTATVNTYNLNGGTLTVPSIFTSATTNLPTRNFNFNGGTLKPTSSNANFMGVAAVTTANVRNSGALINTNGFDITIAAPLTHSNIGGDLATDGGLAKSGTGVLTLTGTGTNYTGPTAVTGGTLALGTGVSLATSSAVSVGAAGGIAPGGGNNITTNSVSALSLTTGSTNYWEFGGGNDQLSATSLTLGGGLFGVYQPTVSPYSTPFSTNGTYDLVTFPAGGFSGSLANLGILPASAVGGKAYSFVLNNATPSLATSLQLIIADATNFAWNGSTTTAWNLGANWNGGSFPNSASVTAAFAGANLTGAANTTAVVDAGGKTVGAITFDNSGGASTFNITGPGTLTLNNGSSASAISVIAGSHTVSAPLALTATTNFTTTSSGDSLTVSGNISGSQPLNISGPGSVTLSGTNAHASTTLGGGTLNIGSAGALGAGSLTVSGASTLNNTSGGALTLSNNYNLNGDVIFTGSNNLNLGSGNVVLGATRTINVVNNTLTAGGVVSGTGFGLTKEGTGTLELSGANTYNGSTIVTGGELKVSGGTTGTSGADIQIARNSGEVATLNITGGSVNANRVIIAGASGNNTAPGTGTVLHSGGTLTSAQWFSVGSGGTTGGDGTYTNTGGTLNVVGQQMEIANFAGSTGTVNLSGSGAINVYNNNFISMGANNSAGNGTVNQNGGTVTLYSNAGITPGGTGVLYLGRAGTLSGTYVYNLNGGVLTVGSIQRNVANTANALFQFNGGTLKAPQNITNWMQNISITQIGDGGAFVDTNGFNATLSNVIQNDGLSTGIGGVTKQGLGTLTLGAADTYTGPTLVSAGRLLLNSTGSINNSSAITVNGAGATFATSSATAVSPTVAVTLGGVDGTGTINTVTVASDASNTVANGLGTSSQLTIGDLTFNGAGAFNVNVTTPATPGIVTTNLAANGAASSVVVNAANSSWANGSVYNLVSYTGAIGGTGFPAFIKGSITGLTSRQTANLTNPAGFLALSIVGDAPKWTGALSSSWNTNVLAAPKNWKLITGGSTTDYIEVPVGDTVLFDDTATGSTTVDIDLANVTPTTTTFNNTSKNYTLTSSSTFGIAGAGTLTKTGTGALTINTANTYSGGTTLNAGVLNVNNTAALGTGTITINGGSLDNTSGSAKTLTANSAQTWNADVTFVGTNDLNMGTGSVTLAGAGTTRTVTTTAGTFSSGAIPNGAGYGITKAGAGTWRINSAGNSNFSGPLAVNAGTLQIGIFDFKSGYDGAGVSLGTGGLTGSATIENGSGTTRWLFSSQDTDSTFAGTLQDGSGGGALGLFKAGTGTLTLSGANTLTSTMTASLGKILLSGSSTAPVIVNATGSFEETAPGSIGGAATFTSAGTSLLAGANSYTGATLINGGTTTVTGTLNNTSSTTIGQAAGAGVLQVQNSSALGSGPLNFDSTGNGSTARLEISNNSSLNNVISLAGRNSSTVAIQSTGGNNTLSGPITINAGGAGYWIQSDAGSTLNLTAPTAITSAAGGTRTITLMGDGNGNISGAITNGTAVTMNLTKEGAGTWTLSGNNTYNGTTAINAGVLKTVVALKNGGTVGINDNSLLDVPLNGGASAVTSIGTLFTGTSNSRIDLHDNDLVLNYGVNPTSYTDTVNKVKSGLTLLGGTGTEGIASTEVDAQTVAGTILAVVDDGDPNIGGGITSISGYTIPNPTQSVLVKYTWFGDANLDGIVDGSDYALTDTGFTSGGALTGWVFGDYDYNGTVDGGDYALQDTGFIAQTGALPEPTTLGLLGLGAVGMLRRRRRQA